MNYLAHFSLAQGDEGLLIGALLGDSVKGVLKGQFDTSWERGIKLHRAIDGFTDQFPANKQAKHLFAAQYERYSSIMLDVFFDYCLCHHWPMFFDKSHDEVVTNVYQLLDQTDWPSAKAKRQATNIVQYDMLRSCGDWQMLEQTLRFISQRFSFENPLSEALPELQKNEAELTELFEVFFPELQAFTKQWQKQN